MWVRSQSKRTLMNCKYFTVDITNVVIGMAGDNYISLGSYSTEEKALKVLDMLHTKLNSRRKGDLINAITLNPKISLNLKIDEGITILDDVFPMPQDSEV